MALFLFCFVTRLVICTTGKSEKHFLLLIQLSFTKKHHVQPSFSGVVNDEYENYLGKRLTNVIKSVVTSSRFRCMLLCSRMDGCLAVNVIGSLDIILNKQWALAMKVKCRTLTIQS